MKSTAHFFVGAFVALSCMVDVRAASAASCSPEGTESIAITVRGDTPIAGAKIVLTYPTAALSLPGTRDDATVVGRVSHVPVGFTSLVNDAEGRLIVTLASGSATLPTDTSFVVQFDRCGGAPTRPPAVGCDVEQAADAFGQLVPGTCSVDVSESTVPSEGQTR